MIDWKTFGNSEIRLKLNVLKEEYEVTKNKISELFDRMEALDREYIRGIEELEERSKQK